MHGILEILEEPIPYQFYGFAYALALEMIRRER